MTNPFPEPALAAVRHAYARQLVVGAGAASNQSLERAFAGTPREAFLGPPPWLITKGLGFETTSARAEPVLVYQDVLIALKPAKNINNGSPSLHARWLHMAAIQPGERIVHIGAGAGYYSAILANLTGPQGHVNAVEFDADLAAAAQKNLARYHNVSVSHADGADWPREPSDVVYVNFAVDRPAPAWIEQLKPGGRLIFPLGTIARDAPRSRSYGVALRIERVSDQKNFAARCLGNAYFVRAEGDPRLIAHGEAREALLTAFEAGGVERIRSLRWRVPASPDQTWFMEDDWSLGCDEP